MARCVIVGAVWLMTALSSARAAPLGKLAVTAAVNGETQKEGCVVRIYAGGSQRGEAQEEAVPLLEGSSEAVLEIAGGTYDVAAVCNTGSLVLAWLGSDVRIKNGKTTALKVRMESGAIIVHSTVNGSRSQGQVTLLFPGSTYQVASGLVGNRIEVATGFYDVRVSSEVNGDHSVVTLERQEVKPGRPRVLRVDMSPGMLQLVVLRNGKPADGAGAVTLPGRVRRIKEFSTDDVVALPPGLYDVLGSLSSSFDFAERRQRNIKIVPGKTTEVSVALVRGSVLPQCVLDGRPAPGTIFGILPGAEDYFNSAPCGQTLELSPGKYHFKLALDREKAGYLVVGGANAPDVNHRNVTVKPGKQTTLLGDFTPGRMLIRTTRNGQTSEAAVTVISTTTGAALGGGPSGEILDVPPGRYDLEVTWPSKSGGARETRRNIVITAGRLTTLDANLERGTLALEVYLGGKSELNAEVLVYKGAATVPYIKGKSGEPLEVPPGEYVPEARLGALRKQFSRMRVKAGDAEMRKVELD
jgi:hypothetical protein